MSDWPNEMHPLHSHLRWQVPLYNTKRGTTVIFLSTGKPDCSEAEDEICTAVCGLPKAAVDTERIVGGSDVSERRRLGTVIKHRAVAYNHG